MFIFIPARAISFSKNGNQAKHSGMLRRMIAAISENSAK
jgi:uncharacterized protein (UPF0332 family)